MNKKFIIPIVLIVLALISVIFLYQKGSEDEWLCADGSWEKHGNPSVPMPEGICGTEPVPLVGEETQEEDMATSVTEILTPENIVDTATSTIASSTDLMGSTTSADLILETPLPLAKVTSPLEIRGTARGNWFFEATFPIVLTDWDGRIIAETLAYAEGDWMTEDFVPFKATIDFAPDKTLSDRGALILRKDNPSGIQENDKAHEITVFFE